MIRRAALVLLASAAFAAASFAAPPESPFTGIRGRAAVDNESVSGVTVLAYRQYENGFSSPAAVRSAPTGKDGLFSLPLPPGDWFVVGARLASGSGAPKAGDLFCYFGGNPVRVEGGHAPLIGLNMARLAPDPKPAGGPSAGLSGLVVDENGKPLPGATVYLYKKAADGFKGMPGVFARTREDGTFQLRVRKGTFFAIARKRQSGEMFGPTMPGDRFGFYAGNPLTLRDGEPRGIRIDAMPRLSQQDRIGEPGDRPEGASVRIRVTDADGRPVAGIRLLAYRSAAMSGVPAFVSSKSGADGVAELAVAAAGRYYLLGREKLGGPAEGEWYGKYGGSRDHSVEIPAGGRAEPLSLVVRKR